MIAKSIGKVDILKACKSMTIKSLVRLAADIMLIAIAKKKAQTKKGDA